MSVVPIGRARRLAKEKAQDVLSTYLNAEITTALANSSYLVKQPLPGIVGAEAVRLADPNEPLSMPVNLEVYVVIYEDGPRVIVRENSSGPSCRKATTHQDYRIVLLFIYQMGNGVQDADGVEPDAILQMRNSADLYLEALVNTIYKHTAVAGSPIHDMSLIDDQNFIDTNDDGFPTMAACTTTWRATQITSIPNVVC